MCAHKKRLLPCPKKEPTLADADWPMRAKGKRRAEEARKALALSGTLAGFVVMTPEELDAHHALQQHKAAEHKAAEQQPSSESSILSRIVHAITGWF